MATLDSPHINNIQFGIPVEFDTVYLNSETKMSEIAVTIAFDITNQAGEVTLYVEDAATPTVIADVAQQDQSVLLGLVSIRQRTKQRIESKVPAGYSWMISKTGAGTADVHTAQKVIYDANPA